MLYLENTQLPFFPPTLQVLTIWYS